MSSKQNKWSGERISADTIQLSIRIEPQPVTNVPSRVCRATEIA